MSWKEHIGKERVVLMVVLSLIAMVSCGRHGKSSHENDEATTAEIVDDQEERNERYRQYLKDRDRESAWQDSMLQVVEKEHDVRYAYIQLLHEIYEMFETPGPEIEYFLFDITQNGTPEIWIVAGNSHADTVFKGYTYRNNNAVCILEGFGCCSAFYLNKDAPYIVQEYGHMSHELRLKHAYNGGKTETTTIFNCGDDYERSYAFERYKKVLESTPYDKEAVVLLHGLTPILKMFE